MSKRNTRRIDPRLSAGLGLWTWLSLARDVIFKARRRELQKYGISARQESFIFVIQALGHKTTPAAISRGVFREAHRISELLNRMERDGRVGRFKDLERKNLIRIRLTEKGLKAHYKLYFTRL